VAEIEIGGRLIGENHPPYVVAEIGQNHNGDPYCAARMIGMAAKCGVDAVKFQLRNADAEIAASQLDRPHPNPEKAFGLTYREHRGKLDLTANDLRHLMDRIRYNEWAVHCFATPCWIGAVEELETLNVPAYKIASKDLTNLPLINEAASTGKPVILSTGMANMQEIEYAIAQVYQHHIDVLVMQCTSQYPCDNANVNLAAMANIQRTFDVPVGFSDHTIGILAAPLAVAFGASMIEKHITLSRAMPGTDHAAAVEEDGLRRMVRDCHEALKMLGTSEKYLLPDVEPAKVKLAGSLVATRHICTGETIQEEDLTLKAPGDGLSFHQRSYVVGRPALRDIEPDEQIRTTDVA